MSTKFLEGCGAVGCNKAQGLCRRCVEKLGIEIQELEDRIDFALSQNYCKICGRTLDGYRPPEKGNQ